MNACKHFRLFQSHDVDAKVAREFWRRRGRRTLLPKSRVSSPFRVHLPLKCILKGSLPDFAVLDNCFHKQSDNGGEFGTGSLPSGQPIGRTTFTGVSGWPVSIFADVGAGLPNSSPVFNRVCKRPTHQHLGLPCSC